MSPAFESSSTGHRDDVIGEVVRNQIEPENCQRRALVTELVDNRLMDWNIQRYAVETLNRRNII